MRVTRETRQELVLTSGGGLLAVAGFLIAVVSAAFIIIQWVGPAGLSEKFASLFPAGGFLLIGLGMLLGRINAEFDRVHEMGEIWWGLWPSVKFKSKTFALKGVERVEIDRILKYKDSSKSRRPCYPVILAGGPEEIEFSKSFQYLESRRIAEAIAGFWEVPLHDRSEGTLVVREPDRLNESLAAQASHRREKPDTLPEPPAEMLSSLEDDGRTLVIEIPLMGFIVFHKIAVLAIMGVFGIITLFQYLTGTLIVVNPPGVNALLLPLIDPVNIISFLGIFFVFQHASERTIITADSQGLLIRKKGMISRTVVKMKAELMEEFFAAAWLTERSARDHGRESLKNMLGLFKKFAKSHSCLIARNDRKVASVTIPVPQAEAEYIAALVTARLSGVK